MKKSLILAGMLSIGYAYAQEGKVGINTSEPKATIDIQPNANNAKETATTNEGILAPRLSKVRVANISEPKQGTLVYVLDENSTENPNALISAYVAGTNTAVDSRVAKITEKGYYFYNGTEWVKAGANGELWAQRDNNGVTETYLKPANTNNDIVSYQSNRRLYNNLGEFGFDTNTFNLGTNLSAAKELPLLNAISSDVLPKQANLGAGNPYTFDNAYLFSTNTAQIKQTHIQSAQNTEGSIKSYAGNSSLLFTDRDVTGNLGFLSGFYSNVGFYSNASANQIMGFVSNNSVGDFTGNTKPTVGVMTGATLYPSALANSKVNSIYGLFASPVSYKAEAEHLIGINTITQSGAKWWYDYRDGGVYPATSVKSVLGVKSQTDALPNATVELLAASHNISNYYGNSNVVHGYGVSNYSYFGKGATVKDFSSYETSLKADGTVNIDNYAVFKFYKPSNLNGFNPKNMYGLWLSDINNGTENNFAIHTGAGKVRIGDLSGTGERAVYVDANGVLKTGTSNSLWYINSDNNYQLNNTSPDAKLNNFYTPFGANWNISKNFQTETYDIEADLSDGSKATADVSNYDDIIKGQESNSMFYNRAYSSEISKVSSNRVRRLMTNELILDNATSASVNDNFTAGSSRIRIPKENTNSYNGVFAQSNYVIHNGIGKIKELFSVSNGMRIQGSVGVARTIDASTGIKTGNVTETQGIRSYTALLKDGDASINHLTLFRGVISKECTFTGNVEDIKGIHLIIPKTIAPTQQYGIFIDDIDGAKEVNGETKNYSIYTKAGKVRVGDLANASATADRVVTVDKDGVLKTTEATASKVASTTSVECKEETRGTMNFGRVSIGGKDTDAIGFCMKNGDNQFRWYYIYGGASHTVGTNANFGQGL